MQSNHNCNYIKKRSSLSKHNEPKAWSTKFSPHLTPPTTKHSSVQASRTKSFDGLGEVWVFKIVNEQVEKEKKVSELLRVCNRWVFVQKIWKNCDTTSMNVILSLCVCLWWAWISCCFSFCSCANCFFPCAISRVPFTPRRHDQAAPCIATVEIDL